MVHGSWGDDFGACGGWDSNFERMVKILNGGIGSLEAELGFGECF